MENKVIIVTGGSRGIGAEIVKKIANKDNHVVLNYNNSENEAQKIKNELAEKQIEIDIFKADIKDRQQVKELIQFCIKKYNKIDVLINNAGVSQIRLFTDITDDDWNNMMQTNLNGAFYTIQESVKYMINNKSGCIINISSIWGQIGASCEVHYSVSKAGLDGMTKALAKELGPSNIRVNSIAPGIIDTQMNEQLTNQEKEELKQEIPLMRIGKCEEIAKCVKWLIEDNYTTGQIISVNGGWNI